jgi:hypothetical protein
MDVQLACYILAYFLIFAIATYCCRFIPRKRATLIHPQLITGEEILCASAVVFLAYRSGRFDRSIRIVKLLLIFASGIFRIGYSLCHKVGMPYLDFEPINGILFLTNSRIIFSPIVGQSLAKEEPHIIMLSELVHYEYFALNKYFKRLVLSLQTDSCTRLYFTEYADKWVSAIELLKEKGNNEKE